MNTIILMYHRLYSSNQSSALTFSKFYKKRKTIISVQNLISDIKYLLDSGWQHVSLEGIEQDKPKSFHITFDDGYKEIINLAVPTLLKFGIKNASFYITTSTIDEKFCPLPLDVLYYLLERDRLDEVISYFNLQDDSSFDKVYSLIRDLLYKMPTQKIYEFYTNLNLTSCDKVNIENQYLNSNDIVKIKNHGFTIGTHGFVHRDYSLFIKESKKELKASMELLQQISGHKITSFAFPDGTYNNDLVDTCKKLGLKYLLAIKKNNPQDKVLTRKFINSKGIQEYV